MLTIFDCNSSMNRKSSWDDDDFEAELKTPKTGSSKRKPSKTRPNSIDKTESRLSVSSVSAGSAYVESSSSIKRDSSSGSDLSGASGTGSTSLPPRAPSMTLKAPTGDVWSSMTSPNSLPPTPQTTNLSRNSSYGSNMSGASGTAKTPKPPAPVGDDFFATFGV
jgi:hypothetical protein